MRKSIIALLAVAVTLASCAKRETLPQGVRGEVQFTTNIQSYAVKATDTAFENGDKVGIFAGAPISKNNVEGTISGTSLTLAEPLYWDEESNQAVEFIGYYPYAANMAKQGSFAVKADQRNAGYTASDLMIAKTISAPTENAVALPFKHALSKVVLNITNSVEGTTINDVRFTDVALSASVDLTSGAISNLAADKGSVKANAAGNAYQLIIIPQSASPKVQVLLSDGNTYTFSVSEAYTFKAGKKVSANLVVSLGAPVVFSFEVSDWEVEEEDLDFENIGVEPTVSEWEVYGSWDEWAQGIAMTKTSEAEAEEEVWEADITYAEGDEFKLRSGDTWAGMKEGWTYYGTGEFEDGYLDATDQAGNIILPEAGEFHLVFSWPSCRFIVTKGGEPEPEPQLGDGWIVKGSWNEWGEGIAMTKTSEAEAEQEEVWEADITYAEGDEFKLNSGDFWAGMKEGWTVYGIGEFDDAFLDATNKAGNIILPEAGEFHLVFSWPSCRFIVTKQGDEPEPEPQLGDGWIVKGSWNEWGEGIAMTKTSEAEAEQEVWEADITYAEGDEFKLNSGDFWAGMKEGWTVYGIGEFDDAFLDATNKAGNIILPEAGEFHLVFSWPSCRFIVTKQGDEPQPQPGEGWEVMGSWNGWTEGIAMALTSEEGAEEEVWEADITYAEGDEFKLRNGSTWAGMKDGWEYYGTGDFPEGYLAADPDKNINIILQGAGEYHLVFSWPSCKFVVTKEGDEPEPIPDSATLTLNVYNGAGWDLKLWAWQGASNLCGTWPGISPNAADVTVAGNTFKSFTVEVASGVAINYLLNNNGEAQTADLSLDGITVEATVYVWLKANGTVEAIADPATFDPSQPVADVWAIVGLGNDWDNGVAMTAVAGDTDAVEADFTVAANEGFKFKVRGGWVTWYGPSPENNDTDVDVTVFDGPMTLYMKGGGNLKIATAGNYHAKLYISGDNAGKVYITAK